jgi:hypothetical protein
MGRLGPGLNYAVEISAFGAIDTPNRLGIDAGKMSGAIDRMEVVQ